MPEETRQNVDEAVEQIISEEELARIHEEAERLHAEEIRRALDEKLKEVLNP